MEDKKSQKSPYRPLGRRLRELRDKAKESLAEVSGAVEIDVRDLASFELGQSKPNEEVLLLLISHFSVHDDEAIGLWELAGYGVSRPSNAHMANVTLKSDSQAGTANHIFFTDIVDVVVNNYGVVMNFMQAGSQNQNPTTVARVGMSREHAKSVLQILKMTLEQTEGIVPKLPKRINSSEDKSDKTS